MSPDLLPAPSSPGSNTSSSPTSPTPINSDSDSQGSSSPKEKTKTLVKVGDYLLLHTLGKGVSGEVKLGQHCVTGERVAIKIMEKSWIRKHNMVAAVTREINLMTGLKHKNVVQLIAVMNSKVKVYMVMEYVDGRELYEEICSNGKIQEKQARNYLSQIIEGVSYCHSQNVSHRDLKPENILVSRRDNTIKIVDFGLSTVCGAGHRRQRTVCGTPNYTAPEVFGNDGRGYDAAIADIWSLGIILYTCIAGYLPFEGKTVPQSLEAIKHQEVTFPNHFSEPVCNLLSMMLCKDPSSRISIEGVMSHPWMTGLESPHINITMQVPYNAFDLVLASPTRNYSRSHSPRGVSPHVYREISPRSPRSPVSPGTMFKPIEIVAE